MRLSKTFTEFHIIVTTSALHWDAYKRFSEFAALHKAVNELAHDDPKIKAQLRATKTALPKLPPTKIVGNLKDNFLQTRMHALDTYISELLAIPQIDTCQPVLEFLGALETTRPEATTNKASPDPADVAAGKTIRSLPHLHLDAVVPLMDAGDVVLFRTSGVLQGLQRTFTGSRYDHVGVVIRIPWGSTKPSALHLLESTSDGVRTYQLARRMRAWHLSNAIVVVRQLKNVRRSDSFLSTLDGFVSDVDGLPYGLTLGKLLRREPGASKDNFFCSELVATAYMRVGLIDSESHSATQFFPSDFNMDNSARLLNLRDGAELGPELLVDFVQPAVREAKQNLSEGEDEENAEMQTVAYQASLAQRAAEAKQRRSIEAARRAQREKHGSMVLNTLNPGGGGGMLVRSTSVSSGTALMSASAATAPVLMHPPSAATTSTTSKGNPNFQPYLPLGSPPPTALIYHAPALASSSAATSASAASSSAVPSSRDSSSHHHSMNYSVATNVNPMMMSFVQASSPARRRHSGDGGGRSANTDGFTLRPDNPFSPELHPFSPLVDSSHPSLSIEEEDDSPTEPNDARDRVHRPKLDDSDYVESSEGSPSPQQTPGLDGIDADADESEVEANASTNPTASSTTTHSPVMTASAAPSSAADAADMLSALALDVEPTTRSRSIAHSQTALATPLPDEAARSRSRQATRLEARKQSRTSSASAHSIASS